MRVSDREGLRCEKCPDKVRKTMTRAVFQGRHCIHTALAHGEPTTTTINWGLWFEQSVLLPVHILVSLQLHKFCL